MAQPSYTPKLFLKAITQMNYILFDCDTQTVVENIPPKKQRVELLTVRRKMNGDLGRTRYITLREDKVPGYEKTDANPTSK